MNNRHDHQDGNLSLLSDEKLKILYVISYNFRKKTKGGIIMNEFI